MANPHGAEPRSDSKISFALIPVLKGIPSGAGRGKLARTGGRPPAESMMRRGMCLHQSVGHPSCLKPKPKTLCAPPGRGVVKPGRLKCKSAAGQKASRDREVAACMGPGAWGEGAAGKGGSADYMPHEGPTLE